MRCKIRQTLALLAIYAIALQTVLAAFAPPAVAAGTFDPAAVICHSVTADDSGGGIPPSAPQVCDHCILCNAGPAAAAPQSVALGVRPLTKSARLPNPPSAVSVSPAPGRGHFARGPPQTV